MVIRLLAGNGFRARPSTAIAAAAGARSASQCEPGRGSPCCLAPPTTPGFGAHGSGTSCAIHRSRVSFANRKQRWSMPVRTILRRTSTTPFQSVSGMGSSSAVNFRHRAMVPNNVAAGGGWRTVPFPRAGAASIYPRRGACPVGPTYHGSRSLCAGRRQGCVPMGCQAVLGAGCVSCVTVRRTQYSGSVCDQASPRTQGLPERRPVEIAATGWTRRVSSATGDRRDGLAPIAQC